MNKSVFALIIVALSGCSSVNKIVKSIVKESKHHIGIFVYDVENEKELIAINEDAFFTPASNVKTYTLLAANDVMGDSLPAFFIYDSPDTLYLWSTGDPTFLHPDYDQQVAFEFLKNQEKPIALNNLFVGHRFGEGWSWDDYNYEFSTEKSGFPIYGNRLWVARDSISSELNLTPKYFIDSITVMESDSNSIKRDESKNQFTLDIDYVTSFEDAIPIHNIERISNKLLSDTLHKEISIHSLPIGEATDQIHSMPKDAVFKHMMQQSDNFLAEQLLLISSLIVTDTMNTVKGIEHFKTKWQKWLPDSLNWIDGSGVSRYNLTTPRNMVAIWEKLLASFGEERLKTIVSIGGVAGNLKNYYQAERPFIYGKTGTLRNNHSLSGLLLTKKGKTLLFSYMNNNYAGSSVEVKQQMDSVLRKIYLEF